MSKKVDTYTRFKDKLQNLFGINKSVPSGVGNKGILKDALLDMASPEINVEWTKEFIPPDKAIIDDDYTLSRIPLTAGIKDLTIYSAQQNIPVLLICEVIGGVPPYTYSWSTPANTTVDGGHTSRGLSATLTAGAGTYSPFICTVKDSANTTVSVTGSVKVIYIPSGQPPPPTEEDGGIISPLPLEVDIRVPANDYKPLSTNPFTILGDGSEAYVGVVSDIKGGTYPYTEVWTVDQSSEGIISNPFGAVAIPLVNGGKTYNVKLSVTDDLGTTVTRSGNIIYEVAEAIECDEDYQYQGRQGIHEVTINYGTATGMCGVWFNMDNVPDALEIWWDGIRVASTPGEVSGKGTLTFNKLDPTPTTATIVVTAEAPGTWWEIRGICPE